VGDGIDKLTAAMAAGDSKAVETFYRRYFDWLYSQARRATRRDEAFCLDVVQDAVLRIIRTVRKVDCDARFRAWLRLVIQTTACDRLRAEQRRVKREAAVTVPASEAVDDEQYEWLKQQVAQFDPSLVRMIEMRFERNWTLARIAGAFGLSVGTIDGRLRRALKELRSRAMEQFDE
jgi:RNA polymerase sigma factor (sigma-70 family)